MKLVCFLSFILMGFVCAGGTRSGRAEVELFVKNSVVVAGGETFVGVRLKPDEGWHSYWKNPGEMGMATSVEWEAPEGVTVGELEFPAPHLFLSSGTKSIGYDGEVTLVAKVKIGEDVKPGKLVLKGKAAWLTCTADACVPGEGDISVGFEVGEELRLSDDAKLISKAINKLPIITEGREARHSVVDKKFVFRMLWPKNVEFDQAEIYVAQESLVKVGGKVVWNLKGDELVGEVALSEYFDKVPDDVEIVLSGKGSSSRGFIVKSKILK